MPQVVDTKKPGACLTSHDRGCSRMAKKRASGTLKLEISGNHSSEPLLKQCKATAAGADILHQSRFYKKVGLKRQSSNMQIFSPTNKRPRELNCKSN